MDKCDSKNVRMWNKGWCTIESSVLLNRSGTPQPCLVLTQQGCVLTPDLFNSTLNTYMRQPFNRSTGLASWVSDVQLSCCPTSTLTNTGCAIRRCVACTVQRESQNESQCTLADVQRVLMSSQALNDFWLCSTRDDMHQLELRSARAGRVQPPAAARRHAPVPAGALHQAQPPQNQSVCP